MTWRHDELLWLLSLLPLFAGVPIVIWRLRLRAMRRFGDPDMVRSLVHGSSARWRATRGVLTVLGLGLLIVTLAGPQYGSHSRMLRKRGVDVVVALDFSKSMLAQDVRPNRIDRAKAELSRLFSELDGDRVGIVAFAGDTMEFPLTIDYSAARLFFRDLGPYDMPVGGTAIGRALVATKRMLDRSVGTGNREQAARSQVVLLLTDGEDHEGDPISAAEELKAAGIRVHTVGIGSPTGEPIPTFSPDGTSTGYLLGEDGRAVLTALTPDNEGALRRIAEITGGRYFRAKRGTVGVDEIRAELRRMRQQERKARRVTVNEDRYTIVLLPAFLFVLLEALLPEVWFRRRPRIREKRA